MRSRYSRLGILDGNHYETFTVDQTNKIKEFDAFEDINTFEYVFKRGDRLDHLAAKFLNNDHYYWVIALINGILSPLSVEPGTKLRIPTDISEVLDRI